MVGSNGVETVSKAVSKRIRIVSNRVVSSVVVSKAHETVS